MNSKCQSNFNFGFTITLNVDPTTFYQNYIGFLTALADSVGLDYGSVAINALKQESTVLNQAIGTLAQAATSTVLNGAISTLAQPGT
jgi:hypothetical protein